MPIVPCKIICPLGGQVPLTDRIRCITGLSPLDLPLPIQTCNDTVNADCIGMTAPKFQLFLKSVLGEVGKEAVFQCQIHGEPAPVITW